MAARVLLVLVAFTILFGCAQANTPIQKQEKKYGLEQATKKPATEVVHAVSQPLDPNLLLHPNPPHHPGAQPPVCLVSKQHCWRRTAAQ